MEEYIIENIITGAIKEIREKKHRPDKESISHLFVSKYGLTMEAALNTVDKMLKEGAITNKKTSSDEDIFIY